VVAPGESRGAEQPVDEEHPPDHAEVRCMTLRRVETGFFGLRGLIMGDYSSSSTSPITKFLARPDGAMIP
jgi:hypothetical protein